LFLLSPFESVFIMPSAASIDVLRMFQHAPAQPPAPQESSRALSVKEHSQQAMEQAMAKRTAVPDLSGFFFFTDPVGAL
jgi:hypothetical protein